MSTPQVDERMERGIEAERGVLGSMLVEGEAIPKALAIVAAADFYREAHRTIFAAMMRLFERGEPIDLVTLSEELRGAGRLEAAGGIAYLADLAANVPTAAHVGTYANKVIKAWGERQALAAAAALQADLSRGDIDAAQQALDHVQNALLPRTARLRPIDLATVRGAMAQSTSGLQSPWRALTQAGVVYEPGTLSILAAPTSAGKTTVLLADVFHWLINPSLSGIIVWWSSEMDAVHLLARLVGAIAGVSMGEVIAQEQRGDLSSDVHQAWAVVQSIADRLVIYDEPMTAEEFAREVTALHRQTQVLAVVVDYLQEMDPVPPDHPLASRYSRNREQEVAATTVILSELARSAKIPVIAAAQLSRQVVYAGKGEHVPELAHLRESGRIEQRATLVVALRNADMSKAAPGQAVGPKNTTIGYRSWPDEDLSEARAGALAACGTQYPDRTLVEVFILKGRIHGGVGNVVPLAMDGRSGWIDELPWRYGGTSPKPQRQRTAGSRYNDEEAEGELIPWPEGSSQ